MVERSWRSQIERTPKGDTLLELAKRGLNDAPRITSYRHAGACEAVAREA